MTQGVQAKNQWKIVTIACNEYKLLVSPTMERTVESMQGQLHVNRILDFLVFERHMWNIYWPESKSVQFLICRSVRGLRGIREVEQISALSLEMLIQIGTQVANKRPYQR